MRFHWKWIESNIATINGAHNGVHTWNCMHFVSAPTSMYVIQLAAGTLLWLTCYTHLLIFTTIEPFFFKPILSLNPNWHECIWMFWLGNVVPFHMIWFLCILLLLLSVDRFALQITLCMERSAGRRWETDGKSGKKTCFVVVFFCYHIF